MSADEARQAAIEEQRRTVESLRGYVQQLEAAGLYQAASEPMDRLDAASRKLREMEQAK